MYQEQGQTLTNCARENFKVMAVGEPASITSPCASDCRVVTPGTRKTIGPHPFSNWGAHHDAYPSPYFTAAAAIGMKKEEVDTFAKRLDKTFTKFKRKIVSQVENNGD